MYRLNFYSFLKFTLGYSKDLLNITLNIIILLVIFNLHQIKYKKNNPKK